MLQTRLSEDDCEKNGYVLTGYPKTLAEGRALQRSGIFPERINIIPSLDSEDRIGAEKSENLKNIDLQIADYRRHFIALSRIYKDKIIHIPADRSLSEVFQRVMCYLSRPLQNPAMWTPRIVLLGFSGSGRKTIAEKLTKKYNLITVHCGTLIRREIIKETKLGMDMKPYVDSHCAVPDEMVINLLKKCLSEAACALKGWILLGYPRTQPQAQALDIANLSPNRVIFLDTNRADAIERLKSREFDEPREMHYNAPLSSLMKRQPNKTVNRMNFKLNRFAAHRIELDEYYGQRILFVDANKDEDTVFENVEYLIVHELPRHIYSASSRRHVMQPGDWFPELPDLILRKIFSYLNPVDFASCAMVNQAWKIAVDFNASASELDLSKIANRATDKALMCLLKRREVTLRKVNLANCSLLTDKGLQALLSCSNLQAIHFPHCKNLTDGFVGSLIQACPSLLKLDLSNTFVSDKSILQLVIYSHKLSWLSIAHCPNITDIGLSFFKGSELSSIVEYINLSGCANITSCGLIDFMESMKNAHTWILKDLPQLSKEALGILSSKANLRSLEVRRGKVPKKYSAIEKQINKFKTEESEVTNAHSVINIKSANLERLCIYGDHTTASIELNSDKLTKLEIVNSPYVNFLVSHLASITR
nr:adenylate kinase [Hymenolepis microstoma]